MKKENLTPNYTNNFTEEKRLKSGDTFSLDFSQCHSTTTDYWNYFFSKYLHTIRLVLGLWTLFCGLFFFTDFSLSEEWQKVSLILRFTVLVPVSFLVFVSTYTRKAKSFFPVGFILLFVLTSVFYAFFSTLPNQTNGQFFILLTFTLILAGAILKARFAWHFIAFNISLVLYFLIIFVFPVKTVDNFFSYLSVTLIAGVAGLVITYFYEKQLHTTFCLHQKLRQKGLQLTSLNSNLNKKIDQHTAELREANSELIRKIEEKNAIEASLISKNKLLDKIFNSVQEGICMVNDNETVEFCNQAFKDIFDDENIEGKNILDFFNIESQEQIKEQSKKRQKGVISTYELAFISPKNNKRYIRVTAVPMQDEETYQGALGTVLDITKAKTAEIELHFYQNQLEKIVENRTAELKRSNEQLQTEITERRHAENIIREQKQSIEKQHNMLIEKSAKLQERNHELVKANERIKANSKLKEIFLTNMSHEIRTPLNAINGYTNLLLQAHSLLTEKQYEYLKNIQLSGKNLLVLINDILDISKIEAGKLTLEAIDFDLHQTIEDFIKSINVKAREKQIQLFHFIEKSVPQHLRGDPYRLIQILNNLVGNGIKFTNEGGIVELQVKLDKEFEAGVRLYFSVRDTGIGIKKEKQQVIFDNFAQASIDTTRQYGGTGLGLAIAKQLVEMQNGKITLESQSGRGTTFYFWIDYEKTDTTAILPEHKEVNDEEIYKKFASYSMKILLVEDNKLNREIAIDTLKLHNDRIHITTAKNGKEAIAKVLTTDFDAIIMDIQMPEMDGIKATEYIRKKLPSQKSSVPIIGLSAHAMKTEKDKCLNAGMNDYITKPFSPQHLIDLLIELAAPKSPKEEADTVENTKKSEPEFQFKYLNLSYLPEAYTTDTKNKRKILTMSYDSISQEMENLNEAATKNDMSKIVAIAHTLKNLVYYLGLLNLRELFISIETDAKAELHEKVKSDIAEAQKIWKPAKIELGKYLQNKG